MASSFKSRQNWDGWSMMVGMTGALIYLQRALTSDLTSLFQLGFLLLQLLQYPLPLLKRWVFCALMTC